MRITPYNFETTEEYPRNPDPAEDGIHVSGYEESQSSSGGSVHSVNDGSSLQGSQSMWGQSCLEK